jgi:hypothetical protein
MIIAAAFDSPAQRGNRRGADRRQLRLEVTGRADTGPAEALIHDLSATGILIETTAVLSVGDGMELELPEAGACHAQVVWSSGHFFGCQFALPLARAAVSAAALKAPFNAAQGSAAATPVPVPSDPRAVASFASDQGLSLAARASVLVGTSILLWALIAAVVSAI